MKNNLQNNTSIEEKKLDWKIVQNVMKDKFGSDIFDSWLKKIELIDEYKNYVLISVSTILYCFRNLNQFREISQNLMKS